MQRYTKTKTVFTAPVPTQDVDADEETFLQSHQEGPAAKKKIKKANADHSPEEGVGTAGR